MKYPHYPQWLLFIISSQFLLSEGSQEVVIEILEDLSDSSSNVIFGFENSEEPFRVLEAKTKEVQFASTFQNVFKVAITNEVDTYSTISDFEYKILSSSLEVTKYEFLNITEVDSLTLVGSFNVTGVFIGVSAVNISFYDVDNQVIGHGVLKVFTLLGEWDKLWGQIFSLGFTIILVFVYINMGASLDLEVIKSIAKRPIGPAIGLASQYVCMPMIAYGLGLLAYPNNNYLRLGMFAAGSAPGGGLSNMWTHIMEGSLDLSIMMTFVSTVAALGMIPLWLLTVGQGILAGEFEIPYTNVIIGIFILVIPIFVGILIQIYFSKVTTVMKKLITPVSAFQILFCLTVGAYSHIYVFYHISVESAFVCLSLTILGCLAGLLMGIIFRRKTKDVIAISIETALQNNAIALVFLRQSIDPPVGDLAGVIPAFVFLMSPIPFFVALIVKKIYGRLKNSGSASIHTEPSQMTKTSASNKNNPNGISNQAFTNDQYFQSKAKEG